ncbi:MAG TPA: hypothetical protein VHU77_02515 [Candidatus Limnocylindria bacterium]|jgi:hypothetical protein|nr:hypothetical protein [Candidatus Limnocylindria bacterium]
MAKRRGKAHNRQQRRNAQRSGQRPGGAAARPAAPAGGLEDVTPAITADGSGMDAFDRADAEVRAAAAPPLSSAAAPRRPKGRAADPRVTVTGVSRLGERAAAEYHYVQRDLRNIAVLVLILGALLAAATIVVHMLGIGQI